MAYSVWDSLASIFLAFWEQSLQTRKFSFVHPKVMMNFLGIPQLRQGHSNTALEILHIFKTIINVGKGCYILCKYLDRMTNNPVIKNKLNDTHQKYNTSCCKYCNTE